MPNTLIKGGAIVSMDPNIPEMDIGDVLIIDNKIAEVGLNISVSDDTKIIDASGMIIMPGMVNGHIHTWQTGLRGLAGDWTTKNYMRAIHAGLATFFQPNDIYIANLVGALNQINNGVTTLVDWHHNNPTPDRRSYPFFQGNLKCLQFHSKEPLLIRYSLTKHPLKML